MQVPSLSSRKLKPPLESRRVRSQPCKRTCLPMASTWRAWATLIFSIVYSRGYGTLRADGAAVLRYYTVRIPRSHAELGARTHSSSSRVSHAKHDPTHEPPCHTPFRQATGSCCRGCWLYDE